MESNAYVKCCLEVKGTVESVIPLQMIVLYRVTNVLVDKLLNCGFCLLMIQCVHTCYAPPVVIFGHLIAKYYLIYAVLVHQHCTLIQTGEVKKTYIKCNV
ncbi:hypothetical protein OTU49_000245 [Cherax quadricarinatus]|uniref:Uncharacterized protein n=1 Tax=Cherax quadricarinatus TaxID=27406 RepID=A0AAW0XLZ3_CHEQU